MPDWVLEAQVQGLVCGVDEAGRGPWAGPVVAAAVILDPEKLPSGLVARIDDSKALSRKQREAVFAALTGCAVIGIGQADVAEIEQLNILWAAMLAMRRAVEALTVRPDFALVDGNRVPELPCASRAVVGGDALSLSIAAASIVAKVTRDRLMCQAAATFPEYGFDRHMGYGTAVHRAALLTFGPSPIHRMGFPSIQRLLQERLQLAEDPALSALSVLAGKDHQE